ncbi:MAG: hypothetical protein V4736_09995 [Bdellovibrionota bacterium]
MKTLITLICASLFIGQVTLAQEAAPPAQTAATATTTKGSKINLNFENELIDGAIDKPDLDMFKNRIPNRFKKLLKIREDFSGEVQKGQVQFEQAP